MFTTENSELYNHPLTGKIIGCAIEVHRQLGPGLLESTYQQCLAHELNDAGIAFKAQAAMPVYYKKTNIDCGYRLDFLVENFVVVELKAVERFVNIHYAQVLTYMKLAEVPLGLLMNFNVGLLKHGIKKFIL